MKENMLDVLLYLFENYSDVDDTSAHDRDTLHHYLQDAGFLPNEIERAFDWLESLTDDVPLARHPHDDKAIRVYNAIEMDRLDAECRGFLLFMEQAGVLSPQMRELVIDRIMDLDEEELELDRLRWVVLMVMFNQQDDDSGFIWLDTIAPSMEDTYYH